MFIIIMFPTNNEIAVPAAAPTAPHFFVRTMLIKIFPIATKMYNILLNLWIFLACNILIPKFCISGIDNGIIKNNAT